MTRIQEQEQDHNLLDTFELRWEAWQVRGRARDERMKVRLRTAMYFAVVLVGGVAVWLTGR